MYADFSEKVKDIFIMGGNVHGMYLMVIIICRIL